VVDPFSRFHTATIQIEREKTTETYRGEEPDGAATLIMSCRCDLQEGGRSLQRARDVYEQADAVVFPSQRVDVVNPEDSVLIEADDGRTLEGRVGRVMPLDNKLLIDLD
jgi:hypothetical protein